MDVIRSNSLVLLMRKFCPREVRQFAQGHRRNGSGPSEPRFDLTTLRCFFLPALPLNTSVVPDSHLPPRLPRAWLEKYRLELLSEGETQQ